MKNVRELLIVFAYIRSCTSLFFLHNCNKIESLAKHQYLLLIQITENNSAVIKLIPQSFAMFQVNLYSKKNIVYRLSTTLQLASLEINMIFDKKL